MVSSHLDEVTHVISISPSWSLLHETLDMEFLGIYCITSEKSYMEPKVTYDIADDLSITVGCDWNAGPCYKMEMTPLNEDVDDENGFSKKVVWIGCDDFIIHKSV